MTDKTDAEEFGLGFGFTEDDPAHADLEPDEECDWCNTEIELELPKLQITKPRFEVEIEFNDKVVSGLYTNNVDTIYIEDDEVRLVDGPIAQVIALDDIKFLRANIR